MHLGCKLPTEATVPETICPDQTVFTELLQAQKIAVDNRIAAGTAREQRYTDKLVSVANVALTECVVSLISTVNSIPEPQIIYKTLPLYQQLDSTELCLVRELRTINEHSGEKDLSEYSVKKRLNDDGSDNIRLKKNNKKLRIQIDNSTEKLAAAKANVTRISTAKDKQKYRINKTRDDPEVQAKVAETFIEKNMFSPGKDGKPNKKEYSAVFQQGCAVLGTHSRSIADAPRALQAIFDAIMPMMVVKLPQRDSIRRWTIYEAVSQQAAQLEELIKEDWNFGVCCDGSKRRHKYVFQIAIHYFNKRTGKQVEILLNVTDLGSSGTGDVMAAA